MLNKKRESSYKTEESHENKNKKKKYEPKELNQINIESELDRADIPLTEPNPKKVKKEISPKKISEKENITILEDEPKLKLETSIKPSLPILNTNNTIKLTIDNKKQKFYTPEVNLEKAEEKFKIFLKKENNISDKDKLEILNEILELCEINPEYNYFYLKYYQKCFDNKNDYLEDKEILAWSLDKDKYTSLFSKNSEDNIVEDIFELLESCDDDKKFQKLAEKVKCHNYNIPLIKAKEKFRLNLYRQQISQRDALFRKKISKYKNLIESMKEKFNKIDPNEKNMNIEIYLFLLCLFEITSDISSIWFEAFFKQILTPLNQINEGQKVNDAIIYSNKNTNSNLIVKDINKDEFIIQNKFESQTIKGSNYIFDKLISEFSSNPNLPLKIILKRNESFSYFCQKKTQIIDDEEIFSEFKNYFNLFIHSNLMKEVLKPKHGIIIELIESNAFPGLFFDSEYIKAIPLYDMIADGYTDKSIIVSLISYYPLIIKDYGIISTKEQYENLKYVSFLFDVCYKFIVSLHEIIIHLCYGYINYITDGKVENISPKSSKNKKEKNNYVDGGTYLEELLLGKDMQNINMQIIYCLLSGEYLEKDLNTFQNDLKLEFDPKKIKMKGLFGKILEKYKIDFSLFQYTQTIGHMRKKSNNFFRRKRCIVVSENLGPNDFRKNRNKNKK